MGREGLVIDVSSVPAKPAGAGRYAIELVSHLVQLAPTFQVDLIAKGLDEKFWENTAQRSVAIRAPKNRATRIVWEQTILARYLNFQGRALYHGIHYTIPSGFRGRRITTIHDLTMLEHPEWHERVKVAYFTRAIHYAVNHADAILVPSNFTKSRLEDHFGIQDRAKVIYHGVDHGRFKPLAEVSEDVIGKEPPFWMGNRYLLHVGTIEPRKNIENLVEAFELLAFEDADLFLVLVGQNGWKSESIFGRITTSRYRERIHIIGYLDEAELLVALQRSSCVVYPSFAEGFGLPVLEALATGVPVVTSRGSVMEEIAGGAAWLCDAFDPSDIATRIKEAISGSSEAFEKVRRGLDRSKQFDWAETARKHIEIYAQFGVNRGS